MIEVAHIRLELAVSRLASIITAVERGQPLALTDAKWFVSGLRKAVFERLSIERSWGLRRNWRRRLIAAETRAAVAAIPRPKEISTRKVAKTLRQSLITYRSRNFCADKDRQPADRADPVLFCLLESRGGRVPSMTVLREMLGQRGPLFSGHKLASDPTQEVNNGEEFNCDGGPNQH